MVNLDVVAGLVEQFGRTAVDKPNHGVVLSSRQQVDVPRFDHQPPVTIQPIISNINGH